MYYITNEDNFLNQVIEKNCKKDYVEYKPSPINLHPLATNQTISVSKPMKRDQKMRLLHGVILATT